MQKKQGPFVFTQRTEIEATTGTKHKKHERQGHDWTVIGPKYNEEPALRSRRHKPDTTLSLKASSGATEGVLD